ncbi:MAG: DUF4190 domain-containing protein [Acidimicrobiales bacterium]
MSETSQGHGWWLASDGKWYPPEAWTGPPPQTGQAPYAVTGYPAGYQSAEPSAPYSAGYPPQGTSWNAPRRTNGLAIASLACACAGIIPFLFGLPSVLGIIFGFVARSQIKNAHGAQGGAGLALAGIIVGFSLIGLFILAVVLVAIFDPSTQPVSAPAL